MYSNPSAGVGVATGGTGVLAYSVGVSAEMVVGAIALVLLLGFLLAAFSRRKAIKANMARVEQAEQADSPTDQPDSQGPSSTDVASKRRTI